MTQLLINVVDISGGTHPDDKVRLWAPQHRADGERVVSTSPVDVKLVDGQATVNVLPGPARVQIMTRGVVDSAAKRVTIPDEASVTLRAVIEDGLEWEPEVISRVATLAARAESAATRAENVAETFGSLEGVAVSVQAAQDAAASATGSASAAAVSATAANDSQVSAASSATAAAQSAVNAANSEWVAGEHKGAAEAASDAAASSASAAATSAGAAASSESAAATSAGQADASAGAASDAATRAENVVDTVQWQGDQLSVMGKVSPPLTGDDGATPHVGANGTWWVGETDTGVQAQGPKGDPGDGAGDVLWSELTPALDGKADVVHSHVVSDVDGLQSALDGKADAGHQHVIADVTGLQDALDNAGEVSQSDLDAALLGKSDVGHVHTIEQVAGLQSALDGKASSSHEHAWSEVTGKPTAYPPESHSHTASQISDATTVGRDVLTATSKAAARQAIGAGTSSLTLGTTASTAAAGNHTHSQYATTAQVEARTPEIRVVTTIPTPPTPGVVYLRFG